MDNIEFEWLAQITPLYVRRAALMTHQRLGSDAKISDYAQDLVDVIRNQAGVK